MDEQSLIYSVEVSVTGSVPAGLITNAAGVSDVEVRGSVLQCRVRGSFQPFLEALSGCEVIRLESVATREITSDSLLEDGNV